MHYDDTIVELVREALIIALKIGAPVLIAGMTIGLIISILQSITSIQDQTLSTVPKIVVMVFTAAMLIPWVAHRLLEYAAQLLRLV
ncbi:MAG: flagellar biosynthetic protein FliQ [Phycisphaeraceae bacterium]|nr:flagellar biosynthetic protein FliQ [Phycisphaeraceae bacterium]